MPDKTLPEKTLPEKTLDVTGLACPLPVLKARKALSELPKGAMLAVLSDDPQAPSDFAAFAESTGNTLIEHSETGGVHRFLLRRSA
jgi:tRNA 2-thiouridine synthesizing protein A